MYADQTKSYYQFKSEAWSIGIGTSMLRNVQDARMHVFNNGLSE